tara:strand:+ start:94 stop:492 length:399 start_codon:yes stop_codon:yes gene_type:complete
MGYKLTFLYDGGCPLCKRETNFLKSRDYNSNILFVDINDKDYEPIKFEKISYEKAMRNLHGILNDGQIIKGLDVLAYSYQIIGMGWVYYPIKIPYISSLLKKIYSVWAKYRLQITGRNNINKLCSDKCNQTF